MYELGNGKTNNFFDKSKGDKYFAEKYELDPENKNDHIVILTEKIKENSIVLDVGCAQGKIGCFLKKEKNCTIYGLDVVKEAVEYVKTLNAYENVFIIDIENEDKSTDTEQFLEAIKDVDYIMLSNVLEHFNDPTKVILKLEKLLKHNGKMLVSVPNIGYADIYLNLMNGTFNYTESGIMDNTHKKFFTKKSFLDWIRDINNYYEDVCLDCEYLGGTYYYNDFIIDLKDRHPNLYHLVESNPDFNVLEILFEITKKEDTPFLDSYEDLPDYNLVNLIDLVLSDKFPDNMYKLNFNERHYYINENLQLRDITKTYEKEREELIFLNNEYIDKILESEKKLSDTLDTIEKLGIERSELISLQKKLYEDISILNQKSKENSEYSKGLEEKIFLKDEYIADRETKINQFNIEISQLKEIENCTNKEIENLKNIIIEKGYDLKDLHNVLSNKDNAFNEVLLSLKDSHKLLLDKDIQINKLLLDKDIQINELLLDKDIQINESLYKIQKLNENLLTEKEEKIELENSNFKLLELLETNENIISSIKKEFLWKFISKRYDN